MEKIQELWKDAVGYKNLYKISNIGRVRKVERYNKLGELIKGKILKPAMDRRGYLRLGLTNNGIRKQLRVHRLVALAFIDNPNDLYSVDHIDENKTNNRVDNLQWLSNGDNIRKSRNKAVRINKGGVTLEFDSCPSASEYIKCHRMSVVHVASGIRNSVYGWKIIYI